MAGFASASARRVWGWTDLYPAPTRFPSTSSHVGHHYGRTRRVGAVHAARDASATITRTGDPEFSVIVEDLRVSLGPASSQRQVINGINLRIKRGSLHMLLGPNGCGKSTLLKVLGGVYRPASGRVLADGPSGFVFQNPDHQVVLPTVAADVAFGLGRFDLPEAKVRESVERALQLVNLRDAMHRATHTLSGGQKQRVAIAGALAESPKLLLLDELTTFLDVEDQFGVLEAVSRITQEARDVTAVWVTHRFEELQFADEATYVEGGRVVFSGSPDEMRKYLERLGAAV